MELAHFWGILFISLHAMVPITLAAIGETIEESAGLFNIGLEGILLLGALAGALGAQASGSARRWLSRRFTPCGTTWWTWRSRRAT